MAGLAEVLLLVQVLMVEQLEQQPEMPTQCTVTVRSCF